MRIPRIYQEQSLALGQLINLDAQASQHLIRVLRLKQGDPILLFNGDGLEYQGDIELISKREAHIRIRAKQEKNLESPLTTILIQGVSRGERMDYTVQKAVELGVQQIYPVITERTGVKLPADRRERRRQHWQSVVTSACEQCGRNTVPPVEPIRELSQWVSYASEQQILQQGLKLALHQHAQVSLRALQVEADRAVILFAGPEGGLTESDLRMVDMMGFQVIRLGPRILRTETAAAAALAVLQAQWGDLAC